MEFASTWINKNGYLVLNYSNQNIESLTFILKPNRTNGMILEFNEDDNIYLKNYQLLINVDGISHTSVNVLNNDYNFISLIFGNHRSLTINDKKEETPFANTVSTSASIIFGDSEDGFEGGIQNVVINHE